MVHESFAKRLWALDSPRYDMMRGNLGIGMSDPTGVARTQAASYLIEHANGLILFDTGLNPAAADDPAAFYPVLHNQMNLQFGEEQRLDRQIEALGFALSDVTHVVVSHLHLDHAGGVYLFNKSEIFVGPGELQYAMWPHQCHHHLYEQDVLHKMRTHRWRQLFDGDHDLFGDGSVVALSTPGHTPGELSLLVRLPGQSIVLTGDTVHAREALERELTFGMDWDSRQARQSLQKLKLIRDSLGAQIWISHDADDWDETKRAPYYYE